MYDDLPPIPGVCSKDMHDFLVQCFRKDPADRPSAEALLEHPWIKPLPEELTVSCKITLILWPTHELIETPG
jgi:serine/threonine protein kinase